jgi:acyl carrier protein
MKRVLHWLSTFWFYASHSRFERQLAARPQLDDRTFCNSWYEGSGIPEDIPIRVRKVYAEQLGRYWRGVRPADKACLAYPDLDFAELLYEIEDEFGIHIPLEDMKALDETFDSVVRYVASRRQEGTDVDAGARTSDDAL